MKRMILILSYTWIKSTLTNFLLLLKWINLLFIHFFCYKYV